MEEKYGSRDIAVAAVKMAMTATREEEKALQGEFAQIGIASAGVDCGGEFLSSISKIIERAVVCAKREGVIRGSHIEEGAVAGAALLCYAVTAFFSVACCITGVYLWLLLAMLAPKEK